ncbi:MAG: hypothetical protein VX467_00140 [Verrucomicrobiota bacterium]|nr:hypothetical protein [Verrucomicrobiota bacterium]
MSSTSNWIMHLDFDSMRESEIGIFVEESYNKIPGVQEKLDWVKNNYGIDMQKVSNFTMFGSGEKHKAIGIMEGGVNSENVAKFADSQDFISKNKIGKYEVFSLNKGRHPMAYAPLKKGKLIVGPDDNYVSEGIALARGKAEGYGGHSLLRKLLKKSLSPGFMVFADLNGISEDIDMDHRAKRMTEVMNAFGMSINEHLGCLKLSGIIEAKSEKSSEQIENMIRGGYAMMKMSFPKDQNIDSMIRDFSIQRNDSTLHIDLEISVDAIIDRLKKEAEKAI